jgi:hypothetical protein
LSIGDGGSFDLLREIDQTAFGGSATKSAIIGSQVIIDHFVSAFLLVAAEELARYVQRLEHEYALNAELDAG